MMSCDKIYTKNILYDIIFIILITLPSLIYSVPWIISTDPGLGVDRYGGGSILIDKTLTDIHMGYIPDWYIGANFILYPVRYIYWVVWHSLSLLTSDHIAIIKYSFLLVFFLSVMTSFMVIKKMHKNRLYGMIGSMLYVYNPYYMAWIGTEAMWSLSLYYAILPLAFYFFVEYNKCVNIENKISLTKLLICSLFLDMILFNHPQAFLILTLPFLIIFSLLYNIFAEIDRSKMNIVSMMRHTFLSLLPIFVSFMSGTFWWMTAITQKNILAESINSIDIINEKTPSFISIITLQGRAWSIPDFDNFFNSNIEMSISLLLASILWISAIYNLKKWKEYNNRKMYWVPSIILSSILFILMTMGPSSPIPIYTWLYHNIPMFSNMRTPDRWLVIIILGMSLTFPLGIEIIMCNFRKISNNLEIIKTVRYMTYIFIIILILANSQTELSYAFKNFKLNTDIYTYYEFLSSKKDHARIFTIPPYEQYKLNENIDDGRMPFVIDPRIWNFMYGKKENFVGGSKSISTKEFGEFIDMIRNLAISYSVNLDYVSDIYGIDYLWIDKTKQESSQYHMNNSVTKLETGNYSLYQNFNPFPRVFIVNESDIGLNSQWQVKSGHIRVENYSNNYLGSFIEFRDENIRESGYIEYNEPINIKKLDEIYGEYSIRDIDPGLVELHLTILDKNENYIWIVKLKQSDGYFRIPIFWFQPTNKNGTKLDFDTDKFFQIKIVESASDIISSKEGFIGIKNMSLFKHELIDTNYQNVDNLPYDVSLHKIYNHSKEILVYNYAYNPNIKLRLNSSIIRSQKIFGFLNGFEIPPGEYDNTEDSSIDNDQLLHGTIEYIPDKIQIYGKIISLATLFIICFLLYDKKYR